MSPELLEALHGLDKPSQKLLKNVVHLPPIQDLLTTFLHDPTRSFEEWIWDPKTREILSRMEAMVDEPKEERPTAAHSQLNQYFHDALVQGKVEDDLDGLLEAAEYEKEAAKEMFAKKQTAMAMNSYKKIADTLKPHLPQRKDFLETYIACCANTAICALKEKRWPIVREYAQVTLVYKKDHAKALYCLAKLYVHEERFNDALDAVQRALEVNPMDQALITLQSTIPKIAEKVSEKTQQKQALLKKKHEEMMIIAKANEEKAREEKEKPAEIKFIALPQPQTSLGAMSALNVYFQKSKQVLGCEFVIIENGPPPKFQCTLTNVTEDNLLLGRGTAGNKQMAKDAAAQAAIVKLWQDRVNQNHLLPEDKVCLEKHPYIVKSWTAPEAETTSMTSKPAQTYSCAIFPSRNDKMQMANMLLNQYTAQGKLHFDYNVVDHSQPTQSDFEVSGILNGRSVATSRGPSKKLAKQQVAQAALAIAYRESREMYPDQTDPHEHY
ncbi:hypothetical protein THRCLA_04566 [Thraustotheca clavata]|uniref:DRBM domain-containing protein n=1 Tax=Thraustotheca clavata TaxID=74557 RepID=A0A1V9ZYP9_9STRA|nr:hypothetical protein THRCLA_04566 [Thraustotheca clavata]